MEKKELYLPIRISSFALMFLKKAFRSGGIGKLLAQRLDNAFLAAYFCGKKSRQGEAPISWGFVIRNYHPFCFK